METATLDAMTVEDDVTGTVKRFCASAQADRRQLFPPVRGKSAGGTVSLIRYRRRGQGGGVNGHGRAGLAPQVVGLSSGH